MPHVEPFKRITSPGATDRGRLFVTIDWDGKRLSITGVKGPMVNGDCRGSCGQTGIPGNTPETGWLKLYPGWDQPTVDRLRETWDRWHLNDMRPGCEHQRDWDILKPLELVELKWTSFYHELSRGAGAGNLSPEDYAVFAERSRATYPLAIEYKRPKHPDLWGQVGESLIAEGYLERGKVETKPACQVYPSEHPEGLLTKPCPECGYRYGSAWLHEDVPSDVLEFLRGLPDAENDMPQCWRR
jgi:hypothetical protein